MKLFLKKIVASAAIFLFSGCQSPEDCLPSETSLSGIIPAGSRNIQQNTPPTDHEEIIRASGFFIENNIILTVSHALPRGILVKNLAEKKRDDENDLLLLESKKCGNTLPVATQIPKTGEEIFDCTTNDARGTMKSIQNTGAENAFGETTLLKNLLFISGNFALGESGKPFCNEQKEVIGILVARNENGGFLRSAEEITIFFH